MPDLVKRLQAAMRESLPPAVGEGEGEREAAAGDGDEARQSVAEEEEAELAGASRRKGRTRAWPLPTPPAQPPPLCPPSRRWRALSSGGSHRPPLGLPPPLRRFRPPPRHVRRDTRSKAAASAKGARAA